MTYYLLTARKKEENTIDYVFTSGTKQQGNTNELD